MGYEVEAVVIEKGCQTRQICKEDAMDDRKWTKFIKAVVQKLQRRCE